MTYYDTKDAFAAIENGSKLRKPDELPFDLCFGGRRQFCQTSYADLGMLDRHSGGSNSSQPTVLFIRSNSVNMVDRQLEILCAHQKLNTVKGMDLIQQLGNLANPISTILGDFPF